MPNYNRYESLADDRNLVGLVEEMRKEQIKQNITGAIERLVPAGEVVQRFIIEPATLIYTGVEKFRRDHRSETTSALLLGGTVLGAGVGLLTAKHRS